jgi:hypothetical protein
MPSLVFEEGDAVLVDWIVSRVVEQLAPKLI